MITPESANKSFADFFKGCEAELRKDVFSTYPTTWNEAPLGPYTKQGTWTNQQMGLLQAYDKRTGQGLWQENEQIIAANKWPQYYIGAYPYCFRDPGIQGADVAAAPGRKSPIMGQSPGTHWYHAHKHGSTAINVANGMTGAFIIEGDYDDDAEHILRRATGRAEQPVMVINQLGVSPNCCATAHQGGGPELRRRQGTGLLGQRPCQPKLEMAPGEVQLWRIVNTSGRSGAFFIGFAARDSSGSSWRRTACSLPTVNYENSTEQAVPDGSGNRVDLLVKAPLTPGNYPSRCSTRSSPTDLPKRNPVTLLQVSVRAMCRPATGNVRRSSIAALDAAAVPDQRHRRRGREHDDDPRRHQVHLDAAQLHGDADAGATYRDAHDQRTEVRRTATDSAVP